MLGAAYGLIMRK